MFVDLLRFELRYWMKGLMVWIFMLILGTLVFAATSSDQVTIGGSIGNTHRNAPFVIETFYSIMGIFSMLMTTAFVNSAASRDFQYGTHQMVFSTPMKKSHYLFGRFLGSTLIAAIPMFGISLGIILAGFMPWIDAQRFGPIHWGAHLQGILTFALPNTFFVASIVFVIAVLTRSTMASFMGTLVLLVGYIVTDVLTEDIDNEKLAMLLDPFAIRTYSIMTKYWTVAERNTRTLSWEGMMLINRLIWLGAGALIFLFGYTRFSFSERNKKAKLVESDTVAPPQVDVPAVQINSGAATVWAQFLGLLRFEFWGLVKTTSFIVIMAAALLNAIPSIIFSAKEGYGNSSYPVTYFIVEVIQGTLYLFVISMITYYAGLLVWRERDARMDEIEDVTASPAYIRYAAKFIALMGIMVILQGLMMLVGIATQTWLGYTRYQIGLYLSELFVYDFSFFVFLAVLAFFVHVLSPNKYVGYFGFVIFLVANAFVWDPLDVATRLVKYGSRPSYTYSDFFGYQPYLLAWWSYTAYWGAFALLLAALTTALWPRGRENALRFRWRNWQGGLRTATLAFAAIFLVLGGWLYYNAAIRNTLVGPKTGLEQQAQYEKKYKQYQKMTLPRITSIRYDIDIFPERRALRMKADQELVNKSEEPIASLHMVLDRSFDYEIQLDGAKLESFDRELGYQIYKLEPAMQPGEKRRMRYTVTREPKGIENSVRVLQIAQNGTFFNNGIAPQLGYQPDRELDDRNERRKRGLPEKDLMPTLERNCTKNCMNTYLSNHSDWVSVESVVSTSPGQIAIAPGSLIKEWQQDGRRYFHYKLDKDSLNFYSFISATYEVARSKWNDVNTEVYYLKEHPWNVEKMQKSIHLALDYCTKNFGPYFHKQARIIEFPRISSFAQAFPGTMPYSESIGFIARLEKPDDIDMVQYVVVHEMAHQWWAHQVIGANMQGATALSEMLAQYSSLMVMEKQYGRDQMRKFLEYEVDRYLSGRGRERLKERPLLTVEAQQGYIHYQKASAAIYYLKEMIGEEAVNRALRKVVEKFAYAQPPYPTSHVLIDAFREETPENMRYLITDLFDDITLFANRTIEAKAKKRADGQYDVSIEVEAKKLKADADGNEKEAAMDDFVDIGAFAAPKDGKRYGETLHRQRVKLKAGQHKFQFVTKELPDKAGIDPFRLLIDRVPADNMKKVSE
jgi:ABC-type transport system involved in multi-copper enzyme maturation permease subunit